MSCSVIKSIDLSSPLYGKVNIGDCLLAINEHPIHDVLDYMYYSYEPHVILTLQDSEKKGYSVSVKKKQDAILDWSLKII